MGNRKSESDKFENECDFIGLPGAVKLTGIARGILYKAIKNNEVPFYKFGGPKYCRHLFKKHELLQWVESHRREQ